MAGSQFEQRRHAYSQSGSFPEGRAAHFHIRITDVTAICSVFSQCFSGAFTFIAADYIFIGYPRLTLAGVAVVNPWKMGNHISQRFLEQLRRFSSELFDIAHSSKAWDTHHYCFQTDGCPASNRSSHDSSSLFFDLDSPCPMSGSKIVHPTFSWRLGGHMCQASTIPRPRVTGECSLEAVPPEDEDRCFMRTRRFR